MTSSSTTPRRVLTILLTMLLVGAMLTLPRAEAAEWWFETLDGKGSVWGGTTHQVGDYSTTLVYGGPHVWYIDKTTSDLRHAWWNGVTWHFEALDGSGGPNGRVIGTVGGPVSSVLYAGRPHVWYTVQIAGSGGVLRHAWWTGATWYFETLDGLGGPNGRTTSNVDTSPEGAVLYGGQPHVWYREAASRLRHAWWTGTTWWFETLDGQGGPNGRTSHAVGTPLTIVLYQGSPHAFYFDYTTASVRHAWWTGWTWLFETLDGTDSAWGGTTDLLTRAISSVSYAGLPHVFYFDQTAGDLRHAWWTGNTWLFGSLDGWWGLDGRTGNAVGTEISAGLHVGRPRVWYRDEDASAMRFAWWNGVKWQFVTLDGSGGTHGRTSNNVAFGISNVLFGGNPHVFYSDVDTSSLRHAWFG